MAIWKNPTPNTQQRTSFLLPPRRFFIVLFLVFVTCVLVFQQSVSWLFFRPSTRTNVELLFGEPTAGGSHIIFLETSCCLKDNPPRTPYDSASGVRMTPRAACAMTSAEQLHPERLVYYLHTCRINRTALTHGEAPAFVLSVLANPNFQLWDIRFQDAFIDTPLYNWSRTNALQRSRYPVTHGSDALRFAVLWKYGGTYLDTDVLMIRSLGVLRDFTSPESNTLIAVSAMDMSMSDVGRQVANMCVDEVRYNFNPLEWGYNGPKALTRVLKKLCATDKVDKMTPERCKGFHVLPTSTFYPVHYERWKLYFQENNAAWTMKQTENSSGVHVWNALSKNTTAFTNSTQPYAQLARKVCPSVVAALNGTM